GSSRARRARLGTGLFRPVRGYYAPLHGCSVGRSKAVEVTGDEEQADDDGDDSPQELTAKDTKNAGHKNDDAENCQYQSHTQPLSGNETIKLRHGMRLRVVVSRTGQPFAGAPFTPPRRPSSSGQVQCPGDDVLTDVRGEDGLGVELHGGPTRGR